MDLMILNTNLDAISVVDTYKSMIWTDRYYQYGDFELYTAVSQDTLQQFKQDYYLQMRGSDHLMIIEKILIESDSEEGDHITITGRSLESILERRVIWGQMTLSGNFQDAIEDLLNACIISPSNVNRKIPNFVFEKSTDPRITDLTLEAQYTGDNLYEVVQALCEERGIGFQIVLNDEKQFVFSLYVGTDRSYDQTEVPYVVFSPDFDNIISSNYMESKSSMKNTALVGGEGEGSERRYTAVGNSIGLDRREMFVDARDISSELDDGQTLSSDEYISLLRQRGKEKLAENADVVSFEGQMETSIMYTYGVDFFQGDIVQIINEYGHNSRVRVLEMIISENEEGRSAYPTFSAITNDFPAGYLKLNYIQSVRGCVIDTGFKPNQNTRVVLDYEPVDTLNTFLFGTRSTDNIESTDKFGICHIEADELRSDYGTGTVGDIPKPEGRTVIDKNKAITTINSVVYTNETATFQSAYTMAIFAYNTANGFINSGAYKLFSCKIYDNGLLVRDYVPVKNEKDVPGLFDLVEYVFYPNVGTGSFITG